MLLQQLLVRDNSSNIILLFHDYFLGVITLPFQIIDLGMNGHALHTNERSEKAREFRQLARDLTVEMNKMTQYMMKVINHYEHHFEQQPINQNDQQAITFNPVTIVFLAFFLFIILFIIKTIFQIGFIIFFYLTNHIFVF